MAKSSKPTRIKETRGGASIQGNGKGLSGSEKPTPRGAGAGANQGGAPRGASRLEPSTTKKGTGRVSGKRQHTNGKDRAD